MPVIPDLPGGPNSTSITDMIPCYASRKGVAIFDHPHNACGFNGWLMRANGASDRASGERGHAATFAEVAFVVTVDREVRPQSFSYAGR